MGAYIKGGSIIGWNVSKMELLIASNFNKLLLSP